MLVFQVALIGFIGLFLTLTAAPLWAVQIRLVFKGPEYVPGSLAGASLALSVGLTLMGVAVWLSLTS